MEENKIKVLNQIKRLAQEDPKFDKELRKMLELPSSANLVISDEVKISEIYEYCIKKILKTQAEDFYKDFPMEKIKPQLIEDYIRMESFKRQNNFEDFCLALYQQIEAINNHICSNPDLTEITSKMWGLPAYIKLNDKKEKLISNRNEKSGYSIAKLLFPGTNKKTQTPYSVEKSRTTLQSQYSNDKSRIIVYFLGYQAQMKSEDYDTFIEITNLLKDIYQCRNLNHRGNILNEWEQEAVDRILPLKSLYYYKFLGVLAQYVEFIKEGVSFLPQMKKYAESIETKKEIGIKQVGFIDPSNFKKKF